MVVVDTSIWSAFFRRKGISSDPRLEKLKSLICENKAVLLGMVKQELLSGIREEVRFKKLLEALSGFLPLLATEEDHILAARFYNMCRSEGIQGSFNDFLICAQSVNLQMELFTNDKDFEHYQKVLPIKLIN